MAPISNHHRSDSVTCAHRARRIPKTPTWPISNANRVRHTLTVHWRLLTTFPTTHTQSELTKLWPIQNHPIQLSSTIFSFRACSVYRSAQFTVCLYRLSSGHWLLPVLLHSFLFSPVFVKCFQVYDPIIPGSNVYSNRPIWSTKGNCGLCSLLVFYHRTRLVCLCFQQCLSFPLSDRTIIKCPASLRYNHAQSQIQHWCSPSLSACRRRRSAHVRLARYATIHIVDWLSQHCTRMWQHHGRTNIRRQ